MSSLFGLKEEEQEILCCGWIRENFDRYNRFSLDLIHFLVTLINPIFYWRFNQQQIKSFSSIKNGQLIKSERFNIHDINFFCTLFPNGYSEKCVDSVMFYLEIAEWPEAIKSITIYFELFEKETKSIWKNVEIFEKDRTYIVRGWNECCLFVSEYLLQTKLKFGVFVDVLALNYAMERSQKPIKLDKQCQYKWIINEYDTKSTPKGRHLFSPNFNNNCFTLYYDGNELGLKLLGLPPGVSGVTVKCDFECVRTPIDKVTGIFDTFESDTKSSRLSVHDYGNVLKWKMSNFNHHCWDQGIKSTIEFVVNIQVTSFE